jgi:subtilisin family serine protease
MKAAIDNLRAAGIATVIASGNNGYCGAISTPACISSAISVGATDDDDAVAYYSNSASFLNLLAPGSVIYSSIPWEGYAYKEGTSMATPHVTGAWALMKQVYPGATVAEILNSFTSTGESVADTKCTSVTKKRINVYEAHGLLGDYASLTVSKTGVGTGTVTSTPPRYRLWSRLRRVIPQGHISNA